MDYRLAGVIASLLLWGMFLLELQVPTMLAILGVSLGFVLLALTRQRMDFVGVLVLINFAYWMFSGLAVDAHQPLDYIKIGFVNGEGRVFVSYLPLLFFSVALVREYNVQRFSKTVRNIAMLCFALYVVWVPTRAGFLSEGGAGNYVAFLTSHTGAGTFFGFLCVFLIIYGYETARHRLHILGWLSLMPLFASASREGLLAFLVAAVWYLIKLKKWRIMAASTVLLTAAIASMPVLAPHTWARTAGLFSMSLVNGVIATIEDSEWEPGEGEIDVMGTQENVLNRIAFWTYAMKRFADSPIVGIGFGRYNDADLEIRGWPGLFAMATDGEASLSVGTAHNSYIHVLCESGLLGLFLLLWLWGLMYVRLGRAAQRFHQFRDAYALFVAAQGVIVFCLIAALPGHALGAPSLMIPAATTIGLALAYQRHLVRGLSTARKKTVAPTTHAAAPLTTDPAS